MHSARSAVQALRADASAEPARTSWFRQRFALASPALRQRFALAPLFGSVHALCHTPPALRAGSAELLAAISASRCMLRSTVPAHGSSQSALRSRAPRGCCHGDRLRVLSLCNRSWNFGSMSLELGIYSRCAIGCLFRFWKMEAGRRRDSKIFWSHQIRRYKNFCTGTS